MTPAPAPAAAPDVAPDGQPDRYAQVIVEVEPDHLDRTFDYRITDELEHEVSVGSRVQVVFAGRRVLGIVAAVTDASDQDPSRIRAISRVLGPHRWLTADELDLLRWAGWRFAAPVATVVRHALPRRVVDEERRAAAEGWFPQGAPDREVVPGDAPVGATAWGTYGGSGRRLRAAAWDGGGSWYWRPLPGDDVGERLADLAAAALAGGRDVLLVVPEPISAAADRVADVDPEATVDVRGAPSPRRLYRAWLRAREGRARVIIGERGVALWPLQRPGLLVLVDEPNPALKERRSPRHHAREVLLERARRAGAVGLLVGTVPSALAWRLLAERRLEPVTPARDRERSSAPVIQVDDRSDPRSRGRIGTAGLTALREAVDRGQLGVVLAARRGEGRALACTRCGTALSCARCGASLAASGSDLACEGCGWTGARSEMRCPACGGERFAPLAAGAQRLGEELARSVPEAEVAVLEGYARAAPAPPAVVVMTRGSALVDPPGPVGAVVLPDLDGQLVRPALDAAEDALRLSMRVAAWVVGVEDGRVVVQTRHPADRAVQALVRWDPGGFWRDEVPRRAELRFPPAAYAIRLDVGAKPDRVVDDLRAALGPDDRVLGPRPDGERASVLVKASERGTALEALYPLRWSWSRDGLDVRVDVDPVDVT